MASLTSYYTFYTISHFVTVQGSQLLLFLFPGAVAAGTIVGGPIGDKIGTRTVIWVSILGIVPFTLALPYANLEVTAVLTIIIGFVLASAFPAIIVFAQELLLGALAWFPACSSVWAFGVVGIAAALLGIVADRTSIEFVYKICSYSAAARFSNNLPAENAESEIEKWSTAHPPTRMRSASLTF